METKNQRKKTFETFRNCVEIEEFFEKRIIEKFNASDTGTEIQEIILVLFFPVEKSGGKTRRVTDPREVYLLIKCIIIYA